MDGADGFGVQGPKGRRASDLIIEPDSNISKLFTV